MSVLHHLAYLRRAKLERKESSEVEFPSVHLHPRAQGCGIPLLRTLGDVAIQSQRKYSPSTRKKEVYFHEHHHTVPDLSPSSPDVLKGHQHTGRLPRTADRRQLHGSPSSAWMPSTTTEREQRCRMPWSMLLAPFSQTQCQQEPH